MRRKDFNMEKTKLILVGGFLGAGKTSMLKEASDILQKRGLKVGLITNDQADNLVDTSLLKNDGNIVYEVSGSCFCCNFPGFAEAVEHVRNDLSGGITLSEPVGSCTDLSATIMQPLKEKYKDVADTAPLSVMADPERLKGILDEKYSTAAYIATKQFDEADFILINKTDLLTAEEIKALKERTEKRWPDARVFTVSVKERTGIDEWLDAVLAEKAVGKNLAEVDYDVYAAGEAAYGWLNATYSFKDTSLDLNVKADALLKTIDEKLKAASVSVGHVKFLLQDGNCQWMGNITGGAEAPSLRKENCLGEGTNLTVNARAEIAPKPLQDMMLKAVDEVFGDMDCTGTEIKSLIPGRPDPTFRYDRIVE